MTQSAHKRGGAPMGYITDLDAIEAASVVYLRLWNDGSVAKSRVLDDFNASLGTQHGQRATRSFEELCSLCARFGRRPLMRHAVTCKCLGADEACFANF